MIRRPPTSTLFPCTTRFRSGVGIGVDRGAGRAAAAQNDLQGALGEAGEGVRSELRAAAAERRAENLCRLPADLNLDWKSTRLNSSHANISYAAFCPEK